MEKSRGRSGREATEAFYCLGSKIGLIREGIGWDGGDGERESFLSFGGGQILITLITSERCSVTVKIRIKINKAQQPLIYARLCVLILVTIHSTYG